MCHGRIALAIFLEVQIHPEDTLELQIEPVVLVLGHNPYK
jgi:hypothetical protein